MGTIRSTIFGAFAAALLPVAGYAATFSGEFFDATTPVGDLATADAIIAANSPTATFDSTGINYPNATNNVEDSITLAGFLGVDAPSLSGAGSTTLEQSVFRFTGFLDLLAGPQMFRVGSDDGFRLTIGGNVISSAEARPFTFTDATVDAGSGRTDFELIFFENQGFTGLQFLIDGDLAAPAAVAPVPLPAGLPLVLIGLGALGVAGRRKRKSA